MAIVNVTGAQAASTTWDLVNDEYHVTGNVTLDAAVVITLSATGGSAVSPAILRFDGNFNMTSTTSGRFTTTGSSATNRIRFQPNGAATTWSATNTAMFVNHGGSGFPTFDYCDLFYVGLADGHTAGNASITNCRWYVGRSDNVCLSVPVAMTAGVNLYQNLQSYGNGNAGSNFNFSMGGGTNTCDSIYVSGAGIGIFWNPSAGTNSLTNAKVVRTGTGYFFAGPDATLTNLAEFNCATGFSFQIVASPAITRLFSLMSADTTAGRVACAPAAGRVHTFEELYIGANGPGLQNTGAVADVVVQNGVVSVAGRFSQATADGILKATSSGNDVVHLSDSSAAAVGVRNGTSDNDYIAGSNGAFAGSVPIVVPGPTSDWNDPNFFINVDTDSGNTTSTSTPIQYRTLTANRTNPIATPHKPTTISGLVVSSITSSDATFDFTTGIRARSRILLSQSSGITQLNASTKTPWKYGGILDPDDPSDFTLPVTTHQHVLADLKSNTTYYYRVECVDPCGRHFLSAEASFSTLAAGGGAIINNRSIIGVAA